MSTNSQEDSFPFESINASAIRKLIEYETTDENELNFLLNKYRNVTIGQGKIYFQNFTCLEDIDLNCITLYREVIFKGCIFEKHFSVVYSSFLSLKLIGCKINTFDGLGIKTTQDLLLCSDLTLQFRSKGTVRLTNGEIGGRLLLCGGRFKAGKNAGENSHFRGNDQIPARGAIDAGNIKVGSSVWMTPVGRKAFKARGLVSFRRAKIEGRLICNRAHFISGTSIDSLSHEQLDYITEQHKIPPIPDFLPTPFLRGYVFGLTRHQQDLPPSTRFKEIEPKYLQSCLTFDLYGAEIKGSVHLKSIISEGTISFGGTIIGSKLSLKGAKIYQISPRYLLGKHKEEANAMAQSCADFGHSAILPWGAFDGFRLNTRGSVYLTSQKRSAGTRENDLNVFTAIGQITLSGAHIGGRLIFSAAKLIRLTKSFTIDPKDHFGESRSINQLDLSGATVALNLLFENETIIFGTTRLSRSTVIGRLTIAKSIFIGSHSDKRSISATNMTIGRDCKIAAGSLFLKNVNLDGSEIGSNFETSLAIFCPSSHFQGDDIEKLFYLPRKERYGDPNKNPETPLNYNVIKSLVSQSINLGINSEQAAKPDTRSLSLRGAKVKGDIALIDSRKSKDNTSLIIGYFDLYEARSSSTIDISGQDFDEYRKNTHDFLENCSMKYGSVFRHLLSSLQCKTTHEYLTVDLTSSQCQSFGFTSKLPDMLLDGFSFERISNISQFDNEMAKRLLLRSWHTSLKRKSVPRVFHALQETEKCMQRHGAISITKSTQKWAIMAEAHANTIERLSRTIIHRSAANTQQDTGRTLVPFFILLLGLFSIIANSATFYLTQTFSGLESFGFFSGGIITISLLFNFLSEKQDFIWGLYIKSKEDQKKIGYSFINKIFYKIIKKTDTKRRKILNAAILTLLSLLTAIACISLHIDKQYSKLPDFIQNTIKDLTTHLGSISTVAISTISAITIILIIWHKSRIEDLINERLKILTGYGQNPFIWLYFTLALILISAAPFSATTRNGISLEDGAFVYSGNEEFWESNKEISYGSSVLLLLYNTIPALGKQPSSLEVIERSPKGKVDNEVIGRESNGFKQLQSIDLKHLTFLLSTLLLLIKLSGWISITFLITGFRKMLSSQI